MTGTSLPITKSPSNALSSPNNNNTTSPTTIVPTTDDDTVPDGASNIYIGYILINIFVFMLKLM